ncbi:LysR substrate-binding domain-containing protein [Mangrovicoccus algicola]|uniref:LysR family transcriptional regulator n=1 Tax=Mangrovicoccus algicola TaxID=2771008 RepID=A0A8J6YV60_9RHOB|nr:LysR substrate-binding domain-containing protein [Mangrovicoccus algicola]MBE3636653.1 LysR family transcriptional regulator [Mangrovicoccus algicola]
MPGTKTMRRFLPSHTALQAFESAARYMSFTKAAEDLSITQSGVSRQIANLEGLLGVKLFERVGSRLVLTDAARGYLPEITAALDRIEQASVSCVRGRSLQEALTIGIHPTLGARWLTPRLGGFLSGNPGVLIELAAITSEPDLSAGRIDAAVLRGRGSWAGCRSQALFPEWLVAVAAAGVIPPQGAGVLDFEALPSLQNASRPDLWLAWLRGAGRRHRGAIRGPRFAQSEMLIAAARGGLGVAVVPLPLVEGELARGELVTPLGEPVPTGESYWLVQPEARADAPAPHRFARWIREEARRFRRNHAPAD